MRIVFTNIIIALAILPFLFLFTSQVHASTLYSNEFTSSFDGFTTSFGECSPSINGLTCSPTASSTYNTELNSAKCVGGEYILGAAGVHGNDLFFSATNFNLNNLIVVKFKLATNITLSYTKDGLIEAVWDTGTETPSGAPHSYLLCKDDGNFIVYLDDQVILSREISDFDGNYVGFQLEPSSTLTRFYVSDEIPAKRTLPLFRQTADAWKSDIYDTAGNWTSGNLTIGRWGCAITSAAMVLKYYGYDLLPNGQELNPGTLNTWLISQRDGYVGSGFTNWLAISRLTKQAKTINNITDHDALEYSRTSGLPANFEDKLPLIVEETGHFFVAKERNGGSISINDPFYNRNSITTNHNIVSVGNYTPSNTDLSYMMLVYDPSFTIKIYDQNNNQVGVEYLQNPIKDSSGVPLGKTQKIYLLQKPGDSIYKISVVSPSKSQFLALEAFLYDTEGNFEVLNLPKAVVGNYSTNISVHYTNEGGDTSSSQKTVTFDQVLFELEAAYKSKYLPQSVYRVLSEQIKLTKKDFEKKKYAVARERLRGIRQQIIPPLSKFISDDYEIIVKKDLEQLQTQI